MPIFVSDNEEKIQDSEGKGALREWFGGWAGALFVFFGLLVLGHISYCLFHWGGDDYAATVSDWISQIAYFVPFIYAWRTWRHVALAPRIRRAWLLIALAHLGFFIGQALWTYFELWLGEAPFPSWADAGFLSYFPLMLAGLLLVVERMQSKEERLGFALDSTIILMGGGLVIWYFLLQPMAAASDGDTLKTTLSLAYPVGDIVLLLGICSLTLRRNVLSGVGPITLLLIGVVGNFAADFCFSYVNLQGTYKTGDFIDSLYTIGLFPIVIAAHYQYILATRGIVEEKERANAKSRSIIIILPYIAVATGYGILISMRVDDYEGFRGLNIIIGAVLTGLVLTRQYLFIRENKQTEKRLQESEERWQLALHINDDGIWDWDIRNKQYFYSPRWRRMFGFDDTEEIDETPGNIQDFFHPDDRPLAMALREQLLGGKDPYFDVEFRHLCKDGSYRWIRCRGEATFDLETGRVDRVIGLDTDIETKKRAELEREAIGKILRGISETSKLDELLALIHESIGKVIYAENCFVALYDKSSDLFKMQFFVDKLDEQPAPSDLVGTRCHYVFRTAEPLLLDEKQTKQLELEGEFRPLGSRPKFWLGTPLKTPSEVIGVLVVQSYDAGRSYENRDLDFLSSVASQIALAIERKMAEEARRLSEEKHRVLFESNPFPVYVYDIETLQFLAVNEAAVKHYGHSREDFLGGLTLLDLRPMEDHDELLERVARVTPEHDTIAVASRHRKKDGSIINVEITSHVLNFDGKPAEIVLVNDITERKAAEEKMLSLNRQLEIQSTRFNDILENTPCVIWEIPIDPEWGQGGFVNSHITKMYGYTPEEWLSTPDFWTTVVHPDDREQLFQEQETLFDEGFGRYRNRWITKDGRAIWGETQIVVFKDAAGKPIGLRGATTDVTDLRKAEIEIEEAKDYLDRIINAIADPIFVNDRDHRLVLVNDAFLQFTRRTREEVIGKSAADLCRPEEARAFQEMDDAVFESGKDTTNEEAFTDRDGNYKVMLTRKTIWTAQDSQKYLVGVIRDITERKLAEEQLRLFNQKLQQSNRELQDFAYVASHDLQEPLRKVQTFAGRLGSKYSERLDETGLDYLERMRSAASRMQTLIQDLLSFSRVTTKAQPFVFVDLEQITREVLSDLEVKIEETGAVVETRDLPRVNADPLQMRQLIQNLVGNALKFCRADATPLIKISATNGQSNGHGRIYTVTVEDNGIGFDEKYLDKIFTVFQRLHGRTEYEGSGIGLAVCRKIVERHHGSITARSMPGEGSKFIFTLPSNQANTEVD